MTAESEAPEDEREWWLNRQLRPGFCRPGWGCRYCTRPKCEWDDRHYPEHNDGRDDA
jgi:hypothetical protein